VRCSLVTASHRLSVTKRTRRGSLCQSPAMAFAHLRGAKSASRQRPTESHRRTRPRPRGRPSHRRQCGEGRDAGQIGESTPCSWICTGRNVAERRPEGAALANHQRWLTVAAGCMADRHREPPRETKTLSVMGATRRKPPRDGGRFRLLSGSRLKSAVRSRDDASTKCWDFPIHLLQRAILPAAQPRKNALLQLTG
jgi:hypothetical protein